MPESNSNECSKPLPAWLRLLPALYLPLILLTVAGYSWKPILGVDDFWAHAAIGRWILENGQIPRETLFLWSEKQSWLPHAWLTQAFFAWLMRVGGESGGPFLALLVTIICSAFPWAVAYAVWRRDNRVTVLLPPIFLVAIWVSSPRFVPRPELFTACLLALLYAFLLQLPRQTKYPWAQAVALMAGFALWPNLHGAVAFGLVILWVSVACEWIQGRKSNEGSPSSRNYALPLTLTAVGATVLLFICNPHGFEYWRTFMPAQSQMFKRIDEWKPFWEWPQLAASAVIAELLLWLLALLLWLGSKDRRLNQLAWLLIMGLFFIRARRTLWLTALTSVFVIAANAGMIDTEKLFAAWRRFSARLDPKAPEGSEIDIPMRAIARGGILFLLVIGISQSLASDFLPLRAVSSKVPTKLAKFVDEKTTGRLLNDYEYSAYLEWYFGERRPLYIDLNNAYPDSLMDEYFVITGGDTKYRSILKERKVEVIALRQPRKTKDFNEGLSDLVKHLNEDTDWKPVYKGTDGSVWVRRKK